MNLKRTYYILKCRVHILFRHFVEKSLLKLSEWGFIKCHRKSYSNTTDDGVIHSLPNLSTKRFIFSVSYVLLQIERKYEYWFETKKGNRIFTVDESHHVEHRVSYRADLKAFFAHFSPKHRMWVYKNAPIVNFFEDTKVYSDFSDPNVRQVETKTHHCDFSKCRFAFDFAYAPELNHIGMSSEVISQSYRALEVQLTSKVSEINKVLTGANYDGEMMSPDKTPLCENLLCNKCGLPVFASAKNKYSFLCLKHGELDYNSLDKVDQILYRNVLDNTMGILEDLISNFDTTECPKD